jgi:hypothetical protein
MTAPRNFMTRAMKSIMNQPQPPAEYPPGDDPGALARELSRQFIARLWEYRKARDGDMSLFDRQDGGWEKLLEAVRTKSPDQVTFDDLERLSREHPDEALARWDQVKATAREDVANGWNAARGIAPTAWQRACFLAIRDELRQTFPPHNGVESMLLDEMAQYEMVRRRLMDQLPDRGWHGDKDRGPQYRVPAAMIQSVDRLQRLFQYALRTLLGLRRARMRVAVTDSHPRAIAGDPPPEIVQSASPGEDAT